MDYTPPNSKIPDKGSPHVLILTLPAQGHTSPMMKLAYRLADLGAKVTFFIPELVYEKLVSESKSKKALRRRDQGTSPQQQEVKIVSFPDGLDTEEERRDGIKIMDRIAQVMPGHVEDFIKKANQPESDEKITCVIADVIVGWGLEISRKMGLKGAAFLSSAPEIVALVLQIPELIKAGIIDAEGSTIKNEQIFLSPYLPAMTSADHTWHFPKNFPSKKLWEKIAFDSMLCNDRYLRISDWVLCNWFRDLDPSADDLLPNTLSIGPLLASPDQPSGNIFSEDITSLTWLDSQPPGSVIYSAFGSTTKFSPHQFDELALGLELMGRPFLWVARSENKVPDDFLKRIGENGKVVQWAPQEKVLAHASVACFFTHCGWNSVIESICMGVPMLCWAFGGDGLYSRTCVCDGWKIGLEVKPEENGMVTRHEIKRKLDELVSNVGIRTNASKLKRLAQKSLSEGGSSTKNLEQFVAQLKL